MHTINKLLKTWELTFYKIFTFYSAHKPKFNQKAEMILTTDHLQWAQNQKQTRNYTQFKLKTKNSTTHLRWELED